MTEAEVKNMQDNNKTFFPISSFPYPFNCLISWWAEDVTWSDSYASQKSDLACGFFQPVKDAVSYILFNSAAQYSIWL